MRPSLTEIFKPIEKPEIVFDDHEVVVAVKPKGMHCAPASDRNSLCSWLFALMPEIALVNGYNSDEGGLLHRLDSATSGLVAFARNNSAFKKIKQDQSEGRFRKHYYALARPEMHGLSGSSPLLNKPDNVQLIEWEQCLRNSNLEKLAYLAKGTTISSVFRPYGPGARKVACWQSGVKLPSNKAWGTTFYKSCILEARAYDNYLLLELCLNRGYRHQIRAHMAWTGLALIGDNLYGAEPLSEANPLLLDQLYLRAFKLLINSPVDGSLLTITI